MKRFLLYTASIAAGLLAYCSSNPDSAGTTNTGNSRVAGVVKDETSAPVANARVAMRGIVVSAKGDSIESEFSTLTATNGTFAIDKVPNGRYVVDYADSVRAKTAIAAVVTHDGIVSGDTAPTLHATVKLSGRVLTASSIDKSKLVVFIPGADIKSGVDASGVYVLGGAPVGRYDICVSSIGAVNYLPMQVQGSGADTVFIRDMALALDRSAADNSYTPFPSTVSNSFSVVPATYDTAPAWYAGKNFSNVVYYRVLDSIYQQFTDTIKIYDTLRVYDTVMVLDTIPVRDTVAVIATVDLTAGATLSKRAAPAAPASSAAIAAAAPRTYYDTVFIYKVITIYDTVRIVDTITFKDTVGWQDLNGLPATLVENFENFSDFTSNLMHFGFNGYWYSFVQGATKITPAALAASAHLGAAVVAGGPRGKYLHIHWNIDPKTNNPPSGIGFAVDGERYVNLKKVKAVSFAAKGKGQLLLSFVAKKTQNYPAAQAWGSPNKVVTLSSAWTRIHIDTSEIAYQPTSPQAIDGLTWGSVCDSIYRVNLLTNVAAGDSVDLSLDEFYFEGISPADLK